MKALVTGANGFLGRYVVRRLLAGGHHVRALVRPSAAIERLGWGDQVEVFRADLRVAHDLRAAFADIDATIHLAACVSGDEDVQFQSSVIGTERLLDAMIAAGARRLVHASSIVVYDWHRARGVVDEDTTPLCEDIYPRDGYDIAKLWQERVVVRCAQGSRLDLTVLRPGFIWGADNQYIFGIGRVFGPLHLVVGPLNRLPTTHVENCADCFVRAAEDERAIGQTFNVVDGEGVLNARYLYEYVRHTHAWGVPLVFPYPVGMAISRAARAVSRALFHGKGKLPGILMPLQFEAQFKPLRFSDRKLRSVLGWSPPLSFEACLERTYG